MLIYGLSKGMSYSFFKLLILYWAIASSHCGDSFRWAVKGLSHTYRCIHSFPNSPPIQAATSHWVEVRVLPRRPSLFSCSVVSNSLPPHGLQHTRLPCRACSNSCSLSWWCHPAISSSSVPFSSCPQSFPASGSFPVSRPFTSGGQSVGASASASVPVVWIFRVDFLQDWLVWSPCSPRDSEESSPTPQFISISSLVLSLLYGPTLTSTHDHWKNHSFD